MTRVAFLIQNSRPLTPEELQAWNFLENAEGIRARKITLAQVANKSSVLASFDVVWWHCDGAYPDANKLTPPVLEAFKKHGANGRGILLSLLACQFVADLGLEEVRPNVVVRDLWTENSWAEGYPDIRGFGGFAHHPVYDGFFGGAYTWAPGAGASYSACYYENDLPKSGKVVAVEKLYIKLSEQRRIMIEYQLGKGRLLCVGSHFYFADLTQQFRPHLEKLAGNCFTYLRATRKARSRRTADERSYWRFDPPHVTPFEHVSKPLGKIRTSLPPISSGLEIHRIIPSNKVEEQFFDLSGRRLLVMGNERAGIAEVWAHPTRVFKNIRTGLKVGDGAWHWLDELNPTITIRPESLTRRYECEGAIVEEVLFAALTLPVGTLHYDIDSRPPVQIVVAGQTDLRLMWPLSEKATGSLRFAWDQGLHCAVIADSTGTNAAVIGSSCPPTEHIVGQFADIELKDDHIVGIPTDHIQVCSALKVALTSRTKRCAFVFAGSSEREALRSYRSAVKDTSKLFRQQVQHYTRLFGSALQLVTPDKEFNRSYHWAIAGTDKLFAQTPGLGSSFLAGYGLSSAGWDGGQDVSGRPGYAWYFGRDSAWTCMAALDYGDFAKARSVLEFLGRHQDINGKILHEMTTSGHAHFDAADSTPLYLIVFGKYLRATGDVAFARKEFQQLRSALSYCFSTDTDGDHLIENTKAGHGWVEGGKLFPAHGEHYLASCWAEALTQMAYVAEAMKEHRIAAQCKREGSTVRSIVKKTFCDDQTGFYSFAKNRDGSFRSEKTVLPTVGMYFDCAEGDFSQRSLAEYASDRFTADWGVRMVGKDDPFFEPAGYHHGSIWPLFTGWTSMAEFHMYRPLQGFGHLMSNALLFDQFSAGCVVEVLHGLRFQPAGVCPHQAWSGSMMLQPSIEGMLGLKIDARARAITLRPYLPPEWKEIEVRNICLGDERVAMKVIRKVGETAFSFSVASRRNAKRSRALQVILQPMFPFGTLVNETWTGAKRKRWDRIVDNYETTPTLRARFTSHLQIRVKHSNGISIVPPRPHFVRGGESRGLRIVDERWEQNCYAVTVEGIAGAEYLVDVFDPSETVKRIDGAIALSREGEYLAMSVIFPENALPGYVRKELKLFT